MSGRVIRLPWAEMVHGKAGRIHQSGELDGERGVVVVRKVGGGRFKVVAAAVDVTTGEHRSKQEVETGPAELDAVVGKQRIRLAHLIRRKYWRRIGRPLTGGPGYERKLAATVAKVEQAVARTARRKAAEVLADDADADDEVIMDFSYETTHADGGPAPCEAAF